MDFTHRNNKQLEVLESDDTVALSIDVQLRGIFLKHESN